MNRMIFKKQKCNTLLLSYSYLSRKKNVRLKYRMGDLISQTYIPVNQKLKMNCGVIQQLKVQILP